MTIRCVRNLPEFPDQKRLSAKTTSASLRFVSIVFNKILVNVKTDSSSVWNFVLHILKMN